MPSDYRTERVDPTLRVLDHPPGHDGAARRHLPPHAYEGQPRPPHHPPAVDVASMLGLPVDAVTPALLAAVAPLLGELDRLRWAAEQAEHRAHWLEHQSDRHSVVPTLNRRAFVRELDSFLVGGDCLGTVAVVHVDGVEGLCRLFGLAAGEGAMRHIAATILGALRSSDVVGCLSGSDFALLLPGTSAEQARAKLDSICQRMVEPPFTWMGNEVALRPECGMHVPCMGDSAETAIAAADLARRGLE